MNSAQTPSRTAIAYLRVSTTEQGDSGLGLEAQEAAVQAWAERSGVRIIQTVTEIQSGKNLRQRPLLQAALADMAAGKADTLVASHVSRLARSVADLSNMLEAAAKQGFALAAIDTGLDTATPAGRMVIQMLAAAAEYERAMTADRTKKALAAAAARGVQLGRPVIADQVATDILRRLRASGLSLVQVANEMNSTGFTTPTGKAWAANNVGRLLARTGGDPLAAVSKGGRPRKAA